MTSSTPLPPPSTEQLEALREYLNAESDLLSRIAERYPSDYPGYAGDPVDTAWRVWGRKRAAVQEANAWPYLAVLAEGLTVDEYDDWDDRAWRFQARWQPVEEGADGEG